MFIVKLGYLDIMQMQEIRQLFLLFFFFSEMRFKEAWTAVDIVFVMVRDFFIYIYIFFAEKIVEIGWNQYSSQAF